MERKKINLLVIVVIVSVCSLVLIYISPKYIRLYGNKDWYEEKMEVKKNDTGSKEVINKEVWTTYADRNSVIPFSLEVAPGLIINSSKDTISFSKVRNDGESVELLTLKKVGKEDFSSFYTKEQKRIKDLLRQEEIDCLKVDGPCGSAPIVTSTQYVGQPAVWYLYRGEGRDDLYTLPTKGLQIHAEEQFCDTVSGCDDLKKMVASLKFLE